MIRIATTLAAAGFIATLAMGRADAAGSHDGTWVVDVPAAGYVSSASTYTCPALRLPIRIENGRIEGNLERVSSRNGNIIVEQGSGRNARPVTGTVAPDGTVDAQWENYHATGRLGPETGEVTIKGECGPRRATAIRITAANDVTTEGAGSSLPPAQRR